MLSSEPILMLIILIIVLHSFIFGYFFGHYTNKHGVNNSGSFFTQQKELTKNKPSISIDDKKFVTEIKTNTLEKKYDSLGDIKSTSENIADSVNKLKNLKG
jgi:hypothetical protein